MSGELMTGLRTMVPPLPIARVGFHALQVPAGDGLAMSFAPLRQRATALIVIETDDGLTGVGESWVNHPPWALAERKETIQQGVAPLLIGQDAREPQGIHSLRLRKLLPIGRQWGAQGPIWQAISAVDIALWDLLGHATGQSSSVLLGGIRLREKVTVYASSLGPKGVVDLPAGPGLGIELTDAVSQLTPGAGEPAGQFGGTP